MIRPTPSPTPLTQPFWEAAQQQKLVLQHCEDCDHVIFPSKANCPECQSCNLRWQQVSGRGTVYSFTIAHRPPHPVFNDGCPFAVAIIETEEGPKMVSNIVNCDFTDISIGMPVSVTFETLPNNELLLPVFRPA